MSSLLLVFRNGCIVLCCLLAIVPTIGAFTQQLSFQDVTGTHIRCQNNCAQTITANDNASITIEQRDGVMEARWDSPLGDILVNNMRLTISIMSCTSDGDCAEGGTYRIQTWDGTQWHTLTTSAQSLNTNITTTESIGIDDGYKARVVNENADKLHIDQFTLTGDFQRPNDDANTIKQFYENNQVFIHRFSVAAATIIGVIFLAVVVRKTRLLHRKKDSDAVTENLDRYNELKEEVASVKRELKSIEKARQDLQKQYYRREVDENTFKDMMQKYEQNRKKLQHQLETLQEEMRSMVVE